MKDLSAAIAAAHQSSGKALLAEQAQDREALRQALEECFHTQRALLAAIDEAQGKAVLLVNAEQLADHRVSGMNAVRAGHQDHARGLHTVPLYVAPQAPPDTVPAKWLRDSALNSARFRARCYALVGIVEGIAGLGRRWASDGERLKDTREWVAFYNSVSAMRNGTTEAPPAVVPANVRERWNIERDGDALRVCFNDHEKGEDCEYVRYVPEAPPDAVPVRGADGGFGWIGSSHGVMTARDAPQAPPDAVANVTPMRQPRADLARLVESINAAVYANGDGLSVTEAIGGLELAKLELLKEQEQ